MTLSLINCYPLLRNMITYLINMIYLVTYLVTDCVVCYGSVKEWQCQWIVWLWRSMSATCRSNVRQRAELYSQARPRLVWCRHCSLANSICWCFSLRIPVLHQLHRPRPVCWRTNCRSKFNYWNIYLICLHIFILQWQIYGWLGCLVAPPLLNSKKFAYVLFVTSTKDEQQS